MYKRLNFKSVFILTSFFLYLLICNGLSVIAAPNGDPLRDFPGINLVSPSDYSSINAVPEQYSTMIRPNANMAYSSKGASSSNNNYVQFNKNDYQKPGPHYVQLDNVAIFQGNVIDLRINVDPNSDSNRVRVLTPRYRANNNMTEFLQVNAWGKDTKTIIHYDFYVHGTEEKVNFSGVWNFRFINDYKGVSILQNQINSIYTFDFKNITRNIPVAYDLNYNTSDNYITIYGRNSSQSDINENAFSVLFDSQNGTFTQIIETLKGNSYTKYSSQPITKMELPSPQIIGNTKEMPNISFIANQDMPLQARENFYPKNYTMYVKLKDADVIDWSNTDVKITDLSNTSSTTTDNYFKVNKDIANNQLVITCNQNTLKNLDFVDNSYFFNVDGKLKESANMNKYYRSDGYYYVPVYVQYKTDTNTSVENKNYAKIKAEFTAKTIEQIVAQGTSTDDWSNYDVKNLFSDWKPPISNEKVKITNIEKTTFSNLKDYTVKVTLIGEESGMSQTFDVPVKVKAKKNITINFIDEKANKISEPVNKVGFENDFYDYSEEVKEVPGYKFLKVDDQKGSSPIKGQFPNASGPSELTINVIYKVSQSKMTIKQVYKTKQTQAIYKDIENQKSVDNKSEAHEETIGTYIPDLIKQMEEKNNKYGITRDFDWYLPINSSQDYIILVDGKEVKTDKVPDKDFELILLYTGITKLEVSDLNYGKIPISKDNNQIYENPNKDNNIKITNTDLSYNWQLDVSLENDEIKNTVTDERYLGGLLVEKNKQPDFITSQGYTFSKKEEQTNKLLSNIPMEIKLYQNTGNSLGKYKGNILWTLKDVP